MWTVKPSQSKKVTFLCWKIAILWYFEFCYCNCLYFFYEYYLCDWVLWKQNCFRSLYLNTYFIGQFTGGFVDRYTFKCMGWNKCMCFSRGGYFWFSSIFQRGGQGVYFPWDEMCASKHFAKWLLGCTFNI